MQIANTPWRRALIFGPPIAVLVLELFHPVDWSAHVHGTDVIARDPAWWTILHIVQLPLFGLLGVSVLALTWGFEGRSVWTSRIGVLLFLVFYSAHDSITGIASGILIGEAEELSETEAALVATQVKSLFLGGGPYTFIPLAGMRLGSRRGRCSRRSLPLRSRAAPDYPSLLRGHRLRDHARTTLRPDWPRRPSARYHDD